MPGRSIAKQTGGTDIDGNADPQMSYEQISVCADVLAVLTLPGRQPRSSTTELFFQPKRIRMSATKKRLAPPPFHLEFDRAKMAPWLSHELCNRPSWANESAQLNV